VLKGVQEIWVLLDVDLNGTHVEVLAAASHFDDYHAEEHLEEDLDRSCGEEDRFDSVVIIVGTVCPGCFSFIEILGEREKFGYLIDICTRVPFGELVGQNKCQDIFLND
jgi:hypothetical protein